MCVARFNMYLEAAFVKKHWLYTWASKAAKNRIKAWHCCLHFVSISCRHLSMSFYNVLVQTPHRHPHLSNRGVQEWLNQSLSILLRDRNFPQAVVIITDLITPQMRANIFDGMAATCNSSDISCGPDCLPQVTAAIISWKYLRQPELR